jgi:hypothetical protein
MMNDSTARHRIDRNWPEWVALGLSIVAVLFSGYAVIDGQRQHRDERASELMEAIYGDWDKMSMADQWEVSHLNEPPETYPASRDRLREYVAGLPRREQLRVAVLERVNAGRIAAFFEHHLNQWRIAREAGDPERLELLQVELDYWCESQLRNPRMLWLMAHDGGGLVDWLDPPNQVYYGQCVLNNPDKPLLQEPDPVGILPADFDEVADG